MTKRPLDEIVNRNLAHEERMEEHRKKPKVATYISLNRPKNYQKGIIK